MSSDDHDEGVDSSPVEVEVLAPYPSLHTLVSIPRKEKVRQVGTVLDAVHKDAIDDGRLYWARQLTVGASMNYFTRGHDDQVELAKLDGGLYLSGAGIVLSAHTSSLIAALFEVPELAYTGFLTGLALQLKDRDTELFAELLNPLDRIYRMERMPAGVSVLGMGAWVVREALENGILDKAHLLSPESGYATLNENLRLG